MKYEDKLAEITCYAYENNDFYRWLAKQNKFDTCSKWENVPIVTKEMILKNEECMVSHSYIPLLYKNQLARTYTSGSTGDFIEVYWSREEYQHSLFPLWVYRLKEYGIHPSDKLCYFYTTRGQRDCEEWFEQYGNRLGFCKVGLDDERLKIIYKKILEFSPKWFMIQPSIAFLLCYIKRKYDLPDIKGIHYMELTGEMLTESLRREIKDSFDCQVANQYGSNEVNSIAYECKEGHLHVMEQNVFVEVLNEKGTSVFEQEGEICVTSLVNRAMPMIRYKIGDRGILHKRENSCNMPGLILELLNARNNDWIITKTHERISPYLLLKVIENINEITDGGIYQFRFCQKSCERILVKMVLDEEINSKWVEILFYENLSRDRLESMNFEFIYEKSIPINETTGKLAWFESDVSE